MKLGLLVVLAVAVLVPSLSESRTASKCELREKLMERLVLPKRYQNLKDTIVKIVICNLKSRTHLKTDKIRVLGHLRKTTTTTTPVPTTPVTTKPTADGSATAKPTTNKTMATNPVTTKPTTTESATAKPTANKTMATNPVATNSTSRATRSNQTTPELGNKRRKREADITSQKSDSDTGGSLEELLNEEQVKFDEEELWQDDNRMEDEDNENDEGVEEQELDDGGKRKKRFLLRGKGRRRKERPWSLGHYGIFALTDSHFCESGYRWSRNACNTSCSAFIDEDISDDCDCAMKTHFWLPLCWSAPRWCRRVSVEKFFRGCD